jgi:replicative DNA helicase
VDYLQLLQGPRGLDRRLEVSTIAAGLKRLARRFGLTVVALSSITPPPPEPGRKPRRPTMRNLRESRDLDHAADIILMLWQPDPRATPRELWIEKGRDGAAGGCAHLDFSPTYVRFQERP